MGPNRQTSITTSKKQIAYSIDCNQYCEVGVFKRKRYCNGKCILTLVEKYTFNKAASAIHLARSDTYHTNANHAHEELRALVKFGRCPDIGEGFTYFDHKNVFTSEPAKIKVTCVFEC